MESVDSMPSPIPSARVTSASAVSFTAPPVVGPSAKRLLPATSILVITHPLIEVKSSVKSGTWRKVGSKPVQWVFGIRSVTFQKKRSKLLREWPHDWHRADNYFHRCSASTLA